MTTQPPPSAADLLEQCASVIRNSRCKCGYTRQLNGQNCDRCRTLAAIDSHRAQSAEVAGDWPGVRNSVIRDCAKIARLALPDNVKVAHWDADDLIPRNAVISAILSIKDAVCGYAPPSAPVRMEEARTARGGVTEAVRALVAQWREEADDGLPSINSCEAAICRCIMECADELEAALSAAPVPDTSAVRAPHEGRKTT